MSFGPPFIHNQVLFGLRCPSSSLPRLAGWVSDRVNVGANLEIILGLDSDWFDEARWQRIGFSSKARSRTESILITSAADHVFCCRFFEWVSRLKYYIDLPIASNNMPIC